jgi:proteasome lid subunit RPN8/RPN11
VRLGQECVAVNLVTEARHSGKLKRGKILLDATSGNTGIAYAMLGAAMGLPEKLCVGENHLHRAQADFASLSDPPISDLKSRHWILKSAIQNLQSEIYPMLRLDPSCYAVLRRHGEETYPYECCGVLLGQFEDDARVVTAIVPCGNTRDDSPHNRYNIDPRDLVRIQREGRERGLDIVGFYHSHPDHPPRWSQTDLAEAHWIGCSYVITSVEKGKAQVTNSFLLAGETEENKKFEKEDVQIA